MVQYQHAFTLLTWARSNLIQVALHLCWRRHMLTSDHMQGLELDGHKLLIQLSQRKRLADDGGKAGKATNGGKANTTKLVRVVCCASFELLRGCITCDIGPGAQE